MRSGQARPAIARSPSGPDNASRSLQPSVAAKIATLTVIALATANCSSPQVATRSGRTIDPKYGVAASPRVIEDGQPVPKGGGRELVGRPYQGAGRTYVPRENASGYSRVGLASWYGSAFHGRLTANGEIFDRDAIGAAHATMPLPSYARVTNTENNRSMIVRVNDRGPYHAARIMDVSERVAEALDFHRSGTARVRVEYVGRASTRGSDDNKLLATLRTDGNPAPFPGAASVMFASADPTPARAQPVGSARRELSRDVVERDLIQVGQDAPKTPSRPAGIVYASAEPIRSVRATEIEIEDEPVAARPLALNTPRPPERPFDLGTIPNAARPIPVASMAPVPPSRPVMAGLFYAPVTETRARFARSDPFKDLKPQRFVALKVTN